MFNLSDVLFIPAIIGIQGTYIFLNNKVITLVSVGLLLLWAYAVTDHKRLVLSVLSTLGICGIVPELVCAQVHDWHLWWMPVTGRCSFEQLWPYQFTTPHSPNVSSHTVKWIMLNDPSEVNTWKWYLLWYCWQYSSVGDIISIPVILFDTIVVVVTLTGTLGTWRVYKTTWNRLTLIHLLAEQSM